MTAPIRFTSGRQQQQKIGVTGDTDNKKVLEVVGRAGIGTTIFEPSTSLDVRGNVNVSGAITATSFDGSFVGTIDSTNIVGASLSISGISTLGITTATDLTLQQLNVSGISTLGVATLTNVTAQQLNVSGISTLGVTTLTNVTAQQLNVSGISTLGVTTLTDVTAQQLNVSGISTLGVTTLTDVTAQQLNISGISTFSSRLQIDANVGIGTTNPTGIVTSTNTTVLHVGVVTANYYYGDGTNLVMTDSIGLGTDTHGEYVKSISGTANEIKVTGGTGEGSTPTIGFEDNPTIGGNVTIGTDLQVNNNLNVTGSITIGGSSVFLDSETLRVQDADIVLGFTTNSNGDDVSTDTTANHGGIAIASTEGNSLVDLSIAGIETLPATYKKIMWFKTGAFSGLNTDAWLSNYAIGIGSTQFPAGTRLAAGSVQFSENDLSVVRNINASGIITATSGFSGTLTGSLVGTATTASNVDRTVTAGLGLTGGGTLTDNITVHVGIGTTAGLERADDEIRLKNYNNLINNNILTWDTTGGIGQISTSQISDNGTNVTIGSGITFYVSSGVVSATSYYGSGGNLEDIIKGKIEGLNIIKSDGTYVGTGLTFSILEFTDDRVSVTGVGSTAQISIGFPGYATTAGFATDLTGGAKGDIPYQTAADSTSFLNIGAQGQVLLASADGLPVWGPVTDASSALGISVEDDLTNVGGVSSVTTINFGSNLGVTSATSEVGLVTVTVSDTPSFTLVSVSSSIGIGTTNPLQALQVGTANASGFTADGTAVVVTGIGSVGVGTISPRYKLDVLGDINLDGTFYQNGSQFVASRWTTGIGDSIYRLSSVGIGTTNPEATLDVKGDLKVGTAITASAGVITATKFVTSGGTNSQFVKGDGGLDSNTYLTAESDTIDTVLGRGNSTTKGVQITGISTLGITTLTDVTAQQLNVSGISSFQDIVRIGTGLSITTSENATDSRTFISLTSLTQDKVSLGFNTTTNYTQSGLGKLAELQFDPQTVFLTYTTEPHIGIIDPYDTDIYFYEFQSRVDAADTTNRYIRNEVSKGSYVVSLDDDYEFVVAGTGLVNDTVSGTNDYAFKVVSNAQTELYYNQNKKLETNNDGVVVTGILTATGFSTTTGTATQFLKADGSVDGSTYLTSVSTADVNDAGAVMNSDTSTTAMNFVVDEDDMASDSATKVPTQQSVKAYVDANAGGTGYQFNVGITSIVSTQLTAIGSNVLTLPSTADKRYIIHSINASNVAAGNTDVNVIGAFDISGGETSYFAYNIPIPTGTTVELLKQPQVLNPSDIIVMRGTDYDRNGSDDVVQVYISYEVKDSTDYFGVGAGIVGIAVSETPNTIYTSTTYPSVIQSIRLANRTDSGGYPVSIAVYSGVTTTYLIDDLIVPKYGSVELLDTPKAIATNDTIQVIVDQVETIDVQVSGIKVI